MFTSTDLKAVITEVRPIIERQLDDATLIAGFRETVTAQGGDWSQVKALVKAMIQDERDEAGGHKRVLAILNKADHALGYADMLGLGNLNEKNSFGGGNSSAEVTMPEHDAETGEIIEPQAAMPAQTVPAAMPEEGAPELASVESSAPSTGAPQRRAQTATGLGAGGDHLGPLSRPTATAKADVPSDQSQASGGGQSQDNSGVRVAPVDTIPEPVIALPNPQAITVAADRGAADAAAPVMRLDRTKPHPDCADPEDCGVEASWNHRCGTCLRRSAAAANEARAIQ